MAISSEMMMVEEEEEDVPLHLGTENKGRGGGILHVRRKE